MGTIDIATRRELFVDHHLIDRMVGTACLKAHSPKREEVVFQVEGPLENACSGVYNLLVDPEGKYRLFSRFSEEGRGRAIQSCTSDDFIHWSTPVPLAWENCARVDQLVGRSVRLRFKLKDADVFSFRFAE